MHLSSSLSFFFPLSPLLFPFHSLTQPHRSCHHCGSSRPNTTQPACCPALSDAWSVSVILPLRSPLLFPLSLFIPSFTCVDFSPALFSLLVLCSYFALCSFSHLCLSVSLSLQRRASCGRGAPCYPSEKRSQTSIFDLLCPNAQPCFTGTVFCFFFVFVSFFLCVCGCFVC